MLAPFVGPSKYRIKRDRQRARRKRDSFKRGKKEKGGGCRLGKGGEKRGRKKTKNRADFDLRPDGRLTSEEGGEDGASGKRRSVSKRGWVPL